MSGPSQVTLDGRTYMIAPRTPEQFAELVRCKGVLVEALESILFAAFSPDVPPARLREIPLPEVVRIAAEELPKLTLVAHGRCGDGDV